MALWNIKTPLGVWWNSDTGAEATRDASSRLEMGEDSKAIHATWVEPVISLSLRYGVLISCALISIGGVMLLLSLLRAPAAVSLSAVLGSNSEEVKAFRSLSEVLAGLLVLDPNAVAALGLLLLVITPTIPVALSAVASLLRRDKPFILVTLFVLGVLIAGLLNEATI